MNVSSLEGSVFLPTFTISELDLDVICKDILQVMNLVN